MDVVADCRALLGAERAAAASSAASALAPALPSLEALRASLASAPGVRFPLAFRSREEEVNFLSLLALLRFGSGWSAVLLASPGGEAADERTLRGLFQLVVGGSRMDADALQNLTETQVAAAWGLHLQDDVPHPTTPLIKMGVDSKSRPYVRLITRTLNEVGRLLWQRQAASLGAFVLAACGSGGVGLARALAAAFPAAFGADAPCHAKALRLGIDLARRFGSELLLDAQRLPAAAEPPLVLALARRGTLPRGGAAAELRAAAVVVVSELAAAAGAEAPAVAAWLCSAEGGGEADAEAEAQEAAARAALSVGYESNLAY